MHPSDHVKLWIVLLKWSGLTAGSVLSMVGALRGLAIRNYEHLDRRRLLLFRLLGVVVALALGAVVFTVAYMILESPAG